MSWRTKPYLTLAGLIGFAALALAPGAVMAGLWIYNAIQYDIHVNGYLKRAADANTVSRAKQELDTALESIERLGWTSGSTHVLYYTPANDVGFWYENLKESSQELAGISDSSPPLERSNMLMKLRETILDEGGESVSVTAPDGISVFPNNKAFFIGDWLSFFWIVGVVVYVLRTRDIG